MRATRLWVVCGVVWACGPTSFEARPLAAAAPTPADPAHAQARASVLGRLVAAQAGGRMLSGQHVGTADSPVGTWRRDPTLREVGAHEVAIAGLEFSYGDFSDLRDDAIDDLIDFAREGGLVTINSAPTNPRTGGGPWDRSWLSLDELFDATTPAARNWAVMVDNLANRLQRLKDAGVIVLFRPLNEMNGAWFWWGGASPERYRRLWRALHDALVVDHQLDNLLWVFAPGRPGQPDPVDFYPGDDVVDVVGLSFYATNRDLDLDAFGYWSTLAAHGKPMAVAECGPPNNSSEAAQGASDYRRLLQVRAAHPFSYFLVWSSWPGNTVALRDTAFGAALLDEASVERLH
jgi:mannan endo-1,4-beta-mannosidase